MSWEQSWDEIYWRMQDAQAKQSKIDVLESPTVWTMYKGLIEGYAESLIWLERGCNPETPRYGRFPKHEEDSKTNSI